MTTTPSAPAATLPGTDLPLSPLTLGGNVFGWTADADASHDILDRFAGAGGRMIDTADMYSQWGDGNSGGESETIIGSWLASRPGRRGDVVIATKVAKKSDLRGLSPATIHAAADASLARLGVDHIDLYYAHEDDPDTPIAETLGAFGQLIAAGKVRHIGASNLTADRVRESLAVADAEGLPRYVALQEHHNLVERDIEADLVPLAAAEGLSILPYFSLASGFLTGKYRPDGDAVRSARSGTGDRYLGRGGAAVLEAMDQIAAEHDAELATIALAWLRARPTVVSPIASARTVEQLPALLAVADLSLTAEEVGMLDAAAATMQPAA